MSESESAGVDLPLLPPAREEFADARGGMDRALYELRYRAPQAFMAMQTALDTQLKAETKLLLNAQIPMLPVHQGRVQLLTGLVESFTLFESRLIRASERAKDTAGKAT